MWNSDQRSHMDKFRDAIRNITTFHQRAKYSEDDDEEQTGGLKKKKKKRPFSLPYWSIYIAWAMVFLAVTVSGFFTVLYSMEWGRVKSVDWLTTFLLSIVQSIVVVQPVKVLLLAMFLSCILKKPDVDDEYMGEEENHLKHDEEFLSRSERDIQEILKQRRAAQTAVDRPNVEALKRAREIRLKQIEMNGIIKECIIYLVFVFVVYFISYQERDFRSFLFAQNVKNQFFGGKPSFSSIRSHEDVYLWINETLMPNLYSGDWYNGQRLTSWREALQTRDRSTIRLGIARLRQLRIKDDTCMVPGRMSSLIHNCRDDYNWMDDDTKDYSPGWLTRNQTNMTEQCIKSQDKYDVWKYRNSLELMCSPYVGAVNTYKGGGYTFNFRRDPRVTIAKLVELADNDWLDVRTRAVFVEFTLYNANVNLYGSVIMLIEFLATGSPIITQEVKVFRLTSYVGPFGIIVIMFQLVFVGFIIYFLVHVINKIRKQKRKYFMQFWNILELVTVIMAILACAMYGAKIMFGNTAMDVLRESGSGKYVNFVTIGIWDETSGFVMAMVVFLATLKFINMLKFNRRMGMLTDTIKLAAKDMKAFVITFFIYFFAFSQLAYLLFGSVLTAYSSFINTIESLFSMALGDFDFHALRIAQPVLGPLFFFFFIAIIFIGMQTMFLTIICEAFTMVRGNLEYQKNDYEIVDYVINKFKGLFGMGRRDENPSGQETPATDANNASTTQ